jgi:hypothetical protein
MLIMATMFVVYVVTSLWYIHKLHKRLKGYEQIWQQIETIADHNQDGTFNINIQHLEETHQINDAPGAQDSSSSLPHELHLNMEDASGVVTLEQILLENQAS